MSTPIGRPLAQGDVLWTPPADARERYVIGRYLGWLERERGLSFDGYDELWRWSVSDLEGFWSSVWEFFEVRSHAPYERVLGSPECPAPSGSRALASTSPSTCSAATRIEMRSRSSPTRRPAAPRSSRSATSREQVARARAGLQRLGRRAGRPRRRVPPEHPRDARRLPRDGEPGSRLGDVPARVRRSQRPPPARPARAEGRLRGRAAIGTGRSRSTAGQQVAEIRDELARPRDRRPRPVRRRPGRRDPGRGLLGRAPRRSPARSSSTRSRSTIRSTCCSRRARPGCRRRSCTVTAASSSST